MKRSPWPPALCAIVGLVLIYGVVLYFNWGECWLDLFFGKLTGFLSPELLSQKCRGEVLFPFTFVFDLVRAILRVLIP